MINYRITKYDPSKRNKEGHYLDESDWTAIGNIGDPKYNSISYQTYESMETAYVQSIQLILKEKKLESLTVNSLERNSTKEDFEKYKKDGRLENISVDFEKEIEPILDGDEIGLAEIEKFTRLILRETIWMLLVDINMEVRFGFDYYLYVRCEKLNPTTIESIQKLGLFVEPNTTA